MSTPDPAERCPYGIGSDHWPGVGKVIEEMNELGTVLGKLMGSGGNTEHWSGDLASMMLWEIGDVLAALQFLTEANRIDALYGRRRIEARRAWKLDLFRSWHRGDPEDKWPKPEAYGLPSRKDMEDKPEALARSKEKPDG